MSASKRAWVLSMEFLLCALLALLAASMRLTHCFATVTVLLWVITFASATQDICADGVYITTLDRKQQADWIGLQGVFWNLGRIFAISETLWLAGQLKDAGIEPRIAWCYALGSSAVLMGGLASYHWWTLPSGALSRRPKNAREVIGTFVDSVKAFGQKESLVGMLVFVGLFRTGGR